MPDVDARAAGAAPPAWRARAAAGRRARPRAAAAARTTAARCRPAEAPLHRETRPQGETPSQEVSSREGMPSQGEMLYHEEKASQRMEETHSWQSRGREVQASVAEGAQGQRRERATAPVEWATAPAVGSAAAGAGSVAPIEEVAPAVPLQTGESCCLYIN